MIISEPKPPEPEIEQKSIKEQLWEEFEKQPDAVLTLALMYARGFDLSGEDLTKAWTNAIRNNQIIEEVYKRGYEDALSDIEKEQQRDFVNKTIVSTKRTRRE